MQLLCAQMMCSTVYWHRALQKGKGLIAVDDVILRLRGSQDLDL